jgi:hypothetical protein
VLFSTSESNEYWVKKSIKFEATFGTKEAYDKIVMTDRISTAALRKLLVEISTIVNSNSK